MSEVPEVPSSAAAPGGAPEPLDRRPFLRAVLAVAVLLVAVVVVILVTRDEGRDDDVTTGDGTEEAVPFWGTTWRIVTIAEGGKDTTPDLPEGKDLLDATTKGRISFTGCNGGAGGASLEGDRLVVEDLMSTSMACVDDDGQVLMDHDAFMAAFLSAKPTVSIEGDQLTLTGKDATITLEVATSGGSGSTTTASSGDPDEPVTSEPVLWGSTWTITRIVDDGEELPVVDAQASGSAPEIDTTDEGAISYTGCNGGRGDATYDAGKLVVGPLMSTKMACEDAALMAQDEFIGSLLGSEPDVSIDGDTLLLTHDQDQLVATRQT